MIGIKKSCHKSSRTGQTYSCGEAKDQKLVESFPSFFLLAIISNYPLNQGCSIWGLWPHCGPLLTHRCSGLHKNFFLCIFYNIPIRCIKMWQFVIIPHSTSLLALSMYFYFVWKQQICGMIFLIYIYLKVSQQWFPLSLVILHCYFFLEPFWFLRNYSFSMIFKNDYSVHKVLFCLDSLLS